MKACHTLCNTLGPTQKSLRCFFPGFKKSIWAKGINTDPPYPPPHPTAYVCFLHLTFNHNDFFKIFYL